jgi:hypothetical protein
MTIATNHPMEVPQGVRQWARPETDDIPYYFATFSYLPASSVTVFAGSGDSDSQQTLWNVNSLSSKTAPEAYADVLYPRAFLYVTANTN